MALGEEAARPGRLRRLQQVVGALGAQPVGEREKLVELLQVERAGQAGHLVDDRLRFRPQHRLPDRRPVQPVGDGRLGAQRPQRVGLGGRTGHAGDLVAGGDELGDELLSDGAGGTGDEHLHRLLLFTQLVMTSARLPQRSRLAPRPAP